MADVPSVRGGTTGDRRLAGRYVLVRPIASGGMARVWEATDAVLNRPVAVKVLHPHLAEDHSFVTRFRAEAVNAARLAHPGIVSIYDTASEAGTEAIVMELVRGTTLRHLLDHRGALEPDEAFRIADHVAAALAAAHQAGIIHRDVKPANVLLAGDGRVLVTDFGIAKAAEGVDLTAEQTMLGTAKYLAPEQVEGTAIDGRADVYALGVVLFEMLTGQPPFRADTEAATALARLHRPAPPIRSIRPALPAQLATLVDRCLARDPNGRPASAGALREELALASRAVAAAPPPPVPAPIEEPVRPTSGLVGPADARPPVPPPPARPTDGRPGRSGRPTSRHRRRRRTRVVAGALVALAAVVGTVLVVRLTSGSSSSPVPLAVGSASAFDPEGSPPGEEHNDAAPLAADGDPATGWTTETYRDPGRLGKAGVGLVVHLDRTAHVDTLVVASPSSDWTASIYATTGPPGADLATWGEPVATTTGLAPPRARFDLHGVEADALLLWITRTGDDGKVEVAEVRATGR